jgi:hypothetical protein
MEFCNGGAFPPTLLCATTATIITGCHNIILKHPAQCIIDQVSGDCMGNNRCIAVSAVQASDEIGMLWVLLSALCVVDACFEETVNVASKALGDIPHILYQVHASDADGTSKFLQSVTLSADAILVLDVQGSCLPSLLHQVSAKKFGKAILHMTPQQINTADESRGQHGYFTFNAKWILVVSDQVDEIDFA